MRRFLWVIALCSIGCGGTAPLAPKAVEMNRLGIESLANGDLTTAEARFAVALEYHPKFVEALVNLGLTELARGNHGRANTLFLRAKRINADVPHPHHGLGVLADKEGRKKDAAEHYRDALKVDPGFVPSRANLARDYFEAGMLDEAREQFLRLTEVAPKDDRGPAGLVETLLRLKREGEADEVLGQARARLGETPRIVFLAARRLLALGDVAGARVALDPLTKTPSDVQSSALAWLAVADLAAEEPKWAEKHAEAALAMDAFDSVATFVMAEALAARNDAAAPEWRARAAELKTHGVMR